MSIFEHAAAPSPSPAADAIQRDLRHTRIMASAGSGKTFQLTNRYLSLIRAGADPESILASTFTRLAAGEIRDRVLTALAELAEDASKRAGLAGHIGGAIEREEAIDMLAALTRRLHRLQVRTLDSFFSAIVRAFALELGIDPAAEIVDEHAMDGLRREAIRRTLEASDEQDAERLLRTLSAMVDELADRSVTDSIDDVVRSLYDLYLEAPAEVWEAVDELPGVLDEKSLDKAIAHLEKTPPTADQRFIKAHQKDCADARLTAANSFAGWMGFLGKGLAKPIASGSGMYYNKPIEPEVVEAYQPLIDHARALARKIVIQRTQATRDLFARYHAHFESLKRHHKAMSFSDLTNALARGESKPGAFGDLDDIYFRLDATLRHLLLDEMQDTSIAQWRAMHPIVMNVAGNAPPDYSFFAVGDVKQSIYGWRGAVPGILESLPGLLFGPGGDEAMETKPLPKSWRSSQVIIDAANTLFESIETNPALEDYPVAANQWRKTYEHHTTAKEDQPGHVVLRTVAEAVGEESKPKVRLNTAAELVAELYRQGGDGITIGVLTRTNSAASYLLHELRELKVPASVRGGGALTDAPAVNAILDLLRLADHPGHSVAAFNVMRSPLGEAIGMTDQGDRAENRRQWNNVSRRVRRQVLDHGYAAMIAEWIGMIAPLVDAREQRRLVLLQDQTVQYDRHASLRCDDYVEYIESIDVADPFASPVQVMTVHQSKGLQFDAVVLPDLEGEVCRTKDRAVLVERNGEAGPITRIARHINNDTTQMFDDLAAMFHAHETAQARESLSLLYVAMTRAKHALHMLIDPPKLLKDGSYSRRRTFARVLREGMSSKVPDPETVLYDDGDATWIDKMRDASESRPPQSGVDDDDHTDHRALRIELAAAIGAVPRGRTGAAASALHEDSAVPDDAAEMASRPAREAFKIPHEAARDRGSAIHAIFEKVGWIEDGLPDDETLLTIVRRAASRRDRAWGMQQVRDFHEMLRKPVVRDALSRPVLEPDSEARFYPEFPYARIVDGAIQRGFIDRLLVIRRAGKQVAARVLDFKTDDVTAEAAAERAARYRSQLAAYRAVVSETFSLDSKAISLELLFVVPGELITVS